MRMTCQQRSR